MFFFLHHQILSALVPDEPFDDCAVTLEISAGIGGQEAMLFAHELFQMYSRFASFQGWDMEDVEESLSEIGESRNLREMAKFGGENVFDLKLKKLQAGCGADR